MAGYRVNFTFTFTNRTKIPFSTVKPWPELSDWTKIPCISTIPCKPAYWKHSASSQTVLNACYTSVMIWRKEFRSSGKWHFGVCWVVPTLRKNLVPSTLGVWQVQEQPFGSWSCRRYPPSKSLEPLTAVTMSHLMKPKYPETMLWELEISLQTETFL